MKRKLIFMGATMMLCITSILAQVPYYGTPFYKEGFDATTLPAGWVQSGLSYDVQEVGTSTTTAWSTTNTYSPPGKNFVNADPLSTYSLLCNIAANTGLVDTLVSPVITNSETDLICVGFSLYDNANSPNFPLGYGYMAFESSKDGGITWDELWRSNGTTAFDYTETAIPITFSGWKTVKINLPATYNGQDFQVRFRIESPDYRVSAMNLYIDGLFVSKRRVNDAQLIKVNNFSTAFSANNKAYLQTPVTVKFINQGASPISSIGVGYKVSAAGQPDQIVSETCNLSTPLQPRDTGTYEFSTYANLSLPRTAYTIKAWTALTDEEYVVDDTLTFNVENTMTGVPYTANWKTSTGVGADEWTVVPAYSASLPSWTQGTYNRIASSFCDASKSGISSDANSYYFSRAVYLKAGKTYELEFNTFTQSDNAADVNAMQVYWTASLDTNTGAVIGNLLFDKADINNVSLRQTVYVNPTQDSAYYFVFKAIGKKGNQPLYIYNVTVREVQNIDAQAISLITPVDKTYRYTNNETVSVTVGNGGLQPISGGSLKVYYQLDDNAPVEETISTTLSLGETINHTFVAKADMTTLKTYNLKIGVSLIGDTSAGNDALTCQLNPMVTELPYNGSLGTNSNNLTYQEDYWTSVNNKWTVTATNTEVRWVCSGTIQTPKATVDTLYSRPIHINAGATCRFSYSIARSMNNTSIFASFKAGVYQKTGDTYTLVTLANDTVIKTGMNVYTTYTHDFTAATEGDYYFGYLTGPVEGGSSFTYSVYMKEPMFTLVGDAGVSQIVSPIFINNCSAATPITVKIQNYGTNEIYSIPVAYSINNEAAVTETIAFSPALAANQTYNYTFKQLADMSGTEDYTIIAYTKMAADENLTNDTADVDIIYAPYQQYGDASNPVVASVASYGHTGGPKMGLLNDGSIFVGYWHATPDDSTQLMPFWWRYNLHVQFLDARGVPQWQQDLKISDNARVHAVDDAATIDKQGNFILGFTNMFVSGDNGEVRISKINANKEYLFGENGIVLSSTADGDPFSVCRTIRTDSRGDIYAAVTVARVNFNNQNVLYKIDGQTGDIVASISFNNISSMEFDKKDNLYVTYQDEAEKLSLQVYNTDLIPLLSNPAIVSTSGVVNTDNQIPNSMIKFDPSGGLWVCYFSLTRYNQTYFVQYFNEDMVPQIIPDGTPVTENTSRKCSNSDASIAVMGDEDALAIVFSESNAGGTTYYYISGQKITKTGGVLMSSSGKDIVDPMLQYFMGAVGLDYHDSKLLLNYTYWKGSGAGTLRNSAITAYDADFENPSTVNYGLNSNLSMKYQTASDSYGIYSVWETNGDNPATIRAQHIYFDETLTNRALSVKVKSNDPFMGYAVGGGLLNGGDTAIMEATAVPGYEFVEWRIGENAISAANPYKFEVTANVTLTAVFRELSTHIITASASSGGTITPSGEVEVTDKENKTFIFTAEQGYELVEVLVDNIAQPDAVTDGQYTFSNVTEDHTIEARFDVVQSITTFSSEESIYSFGPNPVQAGTFFTLYTKLNGEELNDLQMLTYDMNGRLQMNQTNNGDMRFMAPNTPGFYLVQIINKNTKVQLNLIVTP